MPLLMKVQNHPLFQHTAARRRLGLTCKAIGTTSGVSTHSRPKAAGLRQNDKELLDLVSTHSRPKAAGTSKSANAQSQRRFQHTAARRRLAQENAVYIVRVAVSTHSRPKAAGTPPSLAAMWRSWFQHTAARRRLESPKSHV